MLQRQRGRLFIQMAQRAKRAGDAARECSSLEEKIPLCLHLHSHLYMVK